MGAAFGRACVVDADNSVSDIVQKWTQSAQGEAGHADPNALPSNPSITASVHIATIAADSLIRPPITPANSSVGYQRTSVGSPDTLVTGRVSDASADSWTRRTVELCCQG
jgi:hypothetical protein